MCCCINFQLIREDYVCWTDEIRKKSRGKIYRGFITFLAVLQSYIFGVVTFLYDVQYYWVNKNQNYEC